MITPEYKTEILNQLDKLDTEQQKKVLNLIRALVMTRLKGIQGGKLLSFAGTIDANDLQLMEQAIEEGCEKVNLNEW